MKKAIHATARLGKGRSSSRNGKNDDSRESAREGNGNGNGHSSNNGNGSNGGEMHMLPIGAPIKLRKTTPEEAALTAKNYRLAKELSELRVRHREECKNVTRLTMENMNLASRCREAISHVAMLKKDLATSQRRTAEVVHNYQRQQQQQQQQGVGVTGGGAAATSTAATTTSVATTPRQLQQQQQQIQTPPSEIIIIPGSADMAATAAAPPPRSAEKVAPQPSPRALNVARDLEQMDELLHANAKPSNNNNNNTPTNNGSSSSSTISQRGEQPEAAAAAVPVQALEQPLLTVVVAAVTPSLAETSVAAVAPTLISTTAPTVSTSTDNEAASATESGISPSSYPLSEPVDSDDFEDVYNQADNTTTSILLSSRKPTEAATTPTTTPPMSPSSTKPHPLMGNKCDDDDDDDDNDGEDPSDVMGDTTERTGPSSSKLSSAFFPHSASPKLGRGGVGGYNEEFPGDITAVARKPSATRSRLARLSGFAEMDDETTGIIPNINNNRISNLSSSSSSSEPAVSKLGVFDNRAMVAARGGGAQDKSTLSSIDAFEASFRTDFPETFSPRESSSVSEEKKSSTGEPYNPFFPSPQKGRPGADSAASVPVGGGGGAFKTGFVASLVAASKENAAAAAASAGQQEQQLDSSLSPTGALQHHHRFFESKKSKDPPGKDRTSPRSLMKTSGGVVPNSPKLKSVSLSAKDSLASPRNASSTSPMTSALLQRRTGASAALPALDLEKFRSPNLLNSKAGSTPTIVTNNSTPTTPLSPARSSATNETNGSGSGSAMAVGAGALEPKRPEKTGYDLARMRYEKALAHRKTRTPNFDNADNNSAASSQGTAKSSQPRRSSIDSSSHSSTNDVVAKPPMTPKENKNNANSSNSATEAAGAAIESLPPGTILTTPKSSRTAPLEQAVSTPPKSQTTSTSTTTPRSKMAVVDGQPVVSVRDRLTLFSDRTPRSPEKEAARLQAIANGRRLDLDTSYEDEGDIPLPTSINRKPAEETAAAASAAAAAEFSNSTHATTNSASTVLPTRNNPFPPKSPGNSSINSGGSGTTPNGYINGGANQNAANTYSGLTRHRPWDNNNINTSNEEMDFDPTADPKISVSINANTTASMTAAGAALNKPRRSVAHPATYAEPSLRTKLRNGDMFFPKEEVAFDHAAAASTTTTTMPAAAIATNNAE